MICGVSDDVQPGVDNSFRSLLTARAREGKDKINGQALIGKEVPRGKVDGLSLLLV
jgi:hypothetical protein